MMRPDWKWCAACVDYYPPTTERHEQSIGHANALRRNVDKQIEHLRRVKQGKEAAR